MAFDPAQFSNNYNVYQNGQNDTDNRTNQNNQPAGRLKSLKQEQSPKARVCNNDQNSDTAKSKKFNFGKIVRQTTRKIAHSQKDKNKHLFDAIRNGDVKWAKKWIDAGADVNQADNNGITLLHLAAHEGHIEVVKLLLSHPNIDVNQADNNGITLLHLAARRGHVEIVKLLLSRPGIDVNKADNYGWTPLSMAAGRGHVEIVKFLLSRPGIDVNKADKWSQTPLYWAAEYGHVDFVKLLLSHPKINMDKDARRYLDRLVDNNDVYSIQEIVLNGCSKKVYDHLYTKAKETGNPHLIERLSHLFTGYANTQALGGHNKAYSGSGNVPEEILDTVKEYLNSNLPKTQAQQPRRDFDKGDYF
ncbi:MAG: ankyrin repeat domain-containing protein [Desulfobacteraceae bacterium]|nr:ankyrin repeat domain-containing protein [Desulfobacteraceae bacterium]